MSARPVFDKAGAIAELEKHFCDRNKAERYVCMVIEMYKHWERDEPRLRAWGKDHNQAKQFKTITKEAKRLARRLESIQRQLGAEPVRHAWQEPLYPYWSNRKNKDDGISFDIRALQRIAASAELMIESRKRKQPNRLAPYLIRAVARSMYQANIMLAHAPEPFGVPLTTTEGSTFCVVFSLLAYGDAGRDCSEMLAGMEERGELRGLVVPDISHDRWP